jgi:hypothetical protein
MKDIVKNKIVPLVEALSKKPPINWKEAHDMQQKLVISYTLENEKLKDRIKELEAPSESVEKICKQIEEIYNENMALKKELNGINQKEELKQAIWRRK